MPRSVRSRAREIEAAPRRSSSTSCSGRRREGELADEAGYDRGASCRARCWRSPTPPSTPSTSCGRSPTPPATRSRLLDTIADDGAADPQEALATSEVKDRLTEAIGSLPEREQLVVALYYYENLTLREIGEVLGVTESRVSQLHTKAVMRLKSGLQPA